MKPIAHRSKLKKSSTLALSGLLLLVPAVISSPGCATVVDTSPDTDDSTAVGPSSITATGPSNTQSVTAITATGPASNTVNSTSTNSTSSNTSSSNTTGGSSTTGNTSATNSSTGTGSGTTISTGSSTTSSSVTGAGGATSSTGTAGGTTGAAATGMGGSTSSTSAMTATTGVMMTPCDDVSNAPPSCPEPRIPAEHTAAGSTGDFGTTDAVCYCVAYSPGEFGRFGCSNFDGPGPDDQRTLTVNGESMLCSEGTSMDLVWPEPYNGLYYFEIGPGDYQYAALYWYSWE